MGFYTTSKIISQSLFLFFFRGGWAPRSQAQPVRVCDIIVLDKSMGKVYLNPIDKKSIEMRR